jgi:hypothetical protein
MTAVDFGSILSGAGVNAQQQVFDSFGLAVDQFTNRSLSDFVGGVSGSNEGANPYIPGEWNGTNYAEDLIKYQPKHHFMFRVLFDVDPEFSNLVQGRKDVFQYVIKKIGRPKISFEYEPVNYYNFKTQVLKTIDFDPIDITMIDDIQDTFHNFVRTFLMSHSPIARSWNNSQSVSQLEEGGFNFSDAPNAGQDSALRGVLAGGKINPLKSIRLIQYFGHGSAQNTFVFVNPKILDISYDEVHHENGEPNHASIRFDYDALYIENAEQAYGRSPYAVPGRDMFTGITNDYISNGDPYFDGSLGGGLSSLFGGLRSLGGNIASTISSQALSGVSNPYLNRALGNISRNTIYSTTTSSRNTLFSTISGPGVNYNVINSNSNPITIEN